MKQVAAVAQFFECENCHKIFFPQRLICPKCSANSFVRINTGDGVVTEVTRLRDGIYIYSVRALGVSVTCSASTELKEGTKVKISNQNQEHYKSPTVFLPNS